MNQWDSQALHAPEELARLKADIFDLSSRLAVAEEDANRLAKALDFNTKTRNPYCFCSDNDIEWMCQHHETGHQEYCDIAREALAAHERMNK